MVTSFMTTFNASALNLSIPGIGAYFNVSAQAVGWVVTIYALASVAFSLPFGRMADMTSRVAVMRYGIVLFAAGAIASLWSVNFAMFIVMRLVQGVGAAMIFSTNNAILIGAYPPSERGRVLGISVCATYTGLSVGPVIGGVLNSLWGWKSVIVLVGIIGVVTVVMAYAKLPDDGGNFSSMGEFDWTSSGMYSVGLIGLLYGISLIGEGLVSVPVMVAGFAILVLFVRRQTRLEVPLLKVSLFKGNRGFTYSNIAALLNYSATFSISYFMSIYLQIVKGLPSSKAGLIMITAPLVQAVLAPICGKLSDNHSPYKLSSAGMGCCCIALLVMVFLNPDTPYWSIILGLAVMGIGFGLFSTPNTNAIMGCVSPADTGVASSIVATMRNCGQNLSMAIITIIVSLNMGALSFNAAPVELIMSTMRMCYIAFSIICAAGIFIALRRSE